MPFYPNVCNVGTDRVASLGDGYSITITWFQAQKSVSTNNIAYNIYYSTIKDNIFTDGIKYVSIDGSLTANIINLTPGQVYYFAVRPVEYDPDIYDLSILPVAYDNLRVYPVGMLRQDMSETDIIVPLMDVSDFPNTGIVKVGAELIEYYSVDSINNNLDIQPSVGPVPAELVDQSPPDGYYFTANINNIGDGYITDLMAVPSFVARTEDWDVICSYIQLDSDGYYVPGSAKFTAIGSLSKTLFDGYGNEIIWASDGYAVSNGVLSFSIIDGYIPFALGDKFLIKTIAAIPGSTGGRGYDNTDIRIHTTDGYDGYHYYDTLISLYTDGEDNRYDRIFMCQARFEYPNYHYTVDDGYRQVLKDILSTDLSAADADNVDFPMYDYAGYHRTDPVQLLNGDCIGSYIGGEMGCIDKFGNFNIVRGMSLQDQNTQRQDILLSVTGRPAVLIKRVNTGITCHCYLPSSEYPDDRCPKCLGSKFVVGWDQYFNPRSSDGRIMVRVSPTDENLKQYEAGLESELPLDMWTLTVPTIKTRDIIVLFDQDDNEEFRYEVATVNRNNTIVGLTGGQHFKTFRIRKFDPAYQIRIFRNTEKFPAKLNTSIASVPGIAPHVHSITRNENNPDTWSQITSISQGHSHVVLINSNTQLPEVSIALGHTHQIII